MSRRKGKVISVNVSNEKGGPKYDVGHRRAVAESGLEGDAHAGHWHRQASLLAEESIDQVRAEGLEVGPGAFGENVTTRGIELHHLSPGTRLAIGEEVLLEITQIGKECERPCSIFHRIGSCVMPREGVFARVVNGGIIRKGDVIELL